MNSLRPFALTVCLLSLTTSSNAADWPQWNGPTRDGVVPAQNIRTIIPAGGLEQLWQRDVGLGYSGPAVADGRVFLFDYLKASGNVTNHAGKRDELAGKERLLCLDEKTGDVIWKHKYDRTYAVSYGSGPRTTPTIHKDCVYIVGAEGDLTCLKTSTGKPLWHRQFKDDFGGKTPLWGHAASPLVYRDSLICMVGGNGSLVVAFDLTTGKEKWRALSCKETGYCPASIVHRGGVDQLMIWSPEQLSSLNPINGQLYWQHDLKPDYGMSVLPPVYEDGLLFAAGEGSVGAMFKLADDKPKATVHWTGTPKTGLYLATSNAIFSDGHIYGADIRSGALVCAKASDGKRLWQSALPTTGSKRGRGGAHGSAFLMQLDNEKFLIFSETGDVISAKLTPAGYNETGRFHAIQPTGKSMGRDYVWTYPAIANQKLFLRNDKEIACFDLSP